MDPRYTGRPQSPPRRYGQPARGSTGRLDAYPSNYESYYGPPRSSRESIVPGPRSSGERVGTPRAEPRHRDSLRSSRDDYVVPPRRDPLSISSRRPLSVITGTESPNKYRPVISSAADNVPSPYKSRPHEDESYYITPGSSSQNHHHRHFSAGGEDNNRYLDINRDRRPEKGGYRSSGPSKGSLDYSKNLPQIREPRDSHDRDYGYEYTNKEEQVYRDTEPRLRSRRGSDMGRERPYSIAGIEDFQKKSREAGPPVSMRGFSKIEPNGTVRHEYRVPRENDPPSREHSLVRGSREDRDSRLRPSRGLVAVHQENNDGYSSNVEDRNRDRHHKHRRDESVEKKKGWAAPRHYDERRFEERSRVHARSDSEDRVPRAHRHRDISEDRYRPSTHSRRHEREDDVEDRERKYREEPRKEEFRKEEFRKEEPRKEELRKEKHDKHDKYEKNEKHDHRKLAEGLGIGAAGVAATGLVAEAIKHRHDKDASDDENEKDGQEKPRRRRRHKDPDQEISARGEETDDDRRERRRRRRREREERENRERADEEPGALKDSAQYADQERSAKKPEDHADSGEESTRRSRRRHRRERKNSGDSSSDETALKNKERSRVRVVSPPKELEKKPKSILRPPTQKFPEDPAPVREGVAPLKDAGKKGVPVNARWTKVDRRLVNPEALEAGNERYEERADYVIVLRVLSREEIEQYAEITQELRRRRNLASQDEAPRAIEAADHHHGGHSSDDEPPRQIAAIPYNDSVSLPVRDRSVANDVLPPAPSITKAAPHGMAETVVNATHQRATAAAAQEADYGYEHATSDLDRPPLPTAGSYHRVAPPNVPPPTNSSIPIYPSMPPPASASLGVAGLSQAQPGLGRYASPHPPPMMNGNPMAQDPAASWHGTASGPVYPPVPGQSISQGHTPPLSQGPPIPPKERNIDPYPTAGDGY